MSEPNVERDKKIDERFPGNSYTQIKPRPQDAVKTPEAGGTVKKVTGKVKERKKTIGERIADNFLATDKKNVKDHLIFDWLIPGLKNAIIDTVRMVLFGDYEDRSYRGRRDDDRGVRRVPYNSIFDDKRRDDRGSYPRNSRQPAELVFDSRADAKQTLSIMREYIRDYGKATVKDLYSIVDMPTEFPMTRCGWYDLDDAAIVETIEGYVLKMPRVEVFDK